MALTTCACDTGTSTALQPQSGAFCQLQSDSGLPCCNVCASCQTASSPFYSVNINRGRWDCQEWLMAHLNSQSTVMEISTWKGGIAGSSRFSIPRYIFPLHNYFKYKVFLEEVATYAATHCVSQNPDSDLIILLNFPLPVHWPMSFHIISLKGLMHLWSYSMSIST